MYICEKCGREVEEIIETSDGKKLCEDCVAEEHLYCEYCESWVPCDEVHEVRTSFMRTEHICESCLEENLDFYLCAECDTWHCVSYEGSYEADIGIICNNCYNYEYVTCAECGRVIRESDAQYNEDAEEYYCRNCNERAGRIRNYGYKPAPIFKTKHDTFHVSEAIKELMFGVENEIDKGTDPLDTAAAICREAPDVYIKHDGSLGSNGMEIVTHPCSLEYHMENLGWDSICRIAMESDYKRHDARTCGLHVHVGRQQLGETEAQRKETVAKIIVLVARHWDAIVRFSRRREGQLRDWASKPNIDLSKMWTKEDLISECMYERHRGRYRAVNLCNYETIEFRIFNGTLKHHTILATLQLVSNICEYAKENSFEVVLQSTWHGITHYKTYGELQAYLKARGLDEVESPAGIRLYTAEEITAEKERKTFKVGDYVRIKENLAPYWNTPAIVGHGGEVGVIRYVRETRELPYTVEFENLFSSELYSPDNIYTGHGYRVRGDQIERINCDHAEAVYSF